MGRAGRARVHQADDDDGADLAKCRNAKEEIASQEFRSWRGRRRKSTRHSTQTISPFAA